MEYFKCTHYIVNIYFISDDLLRTNSVSKQNQRTHQVHSQQREK